ncbi:SDR family NAD(P)-dependent oxidoreductase [Corynebacterium sp. A21]|uniref:SDR family NAD(P)-dependent oxidoreductase n=1 Tax=Corynebacterium sp. A21 TaxID=3457318 RepID=UPI003FD15732
MRTILITGASDGIGAAAATQLAHQGDKLVLVGRSPERTRAIAVRLGAEYHLVDYTELDQVRELAATLNQRYERIDVLANNAGGLFSGPVRTVDGFERTFQVNHLAPFLLTQLLFDTLIASNACVINTASVAARFFGHLDLNDLNTWRNFRSNLAYGNAKLANIIFAQQLHERFHDRGLSAVSFHPGLIATSFGAESEGVMQRIYHGIGSRFLASPEKGGETLAHFINGSPGVDWQSGKFYGANRKPARTNTQAGNPRLAERTWELSSQMLAIRW